MEEPEAEEMYSKKTSSGHGTAVALMNSLCSSGYRHKIYYTKSGYAP